MRTRRPQRGQALVGLAIAVALLGLVFAVVFANMQRKYYDDAANVDGAALAQYGVGLRGYIANVQGGSATMPTNPYTVVGVNWLKAPTCGGLATNPPQGYVPCSYDGGVLGPNYQTTITQTPATNTIEARTWFMAPLAGSDAASRGSMAAKIVFATLAQQTLPINGMFLTAFANSPVTATAPVTPSAINPADRGRVLLVANNSPSNDIWLRVDGTNKMLADLNMGGHSLVNAQNGSFAGSVRVQGTEQIDNGLSVTNGTVDARGGVLAPDVEITGIDRYASQAIYDAQVFTGATNYSVPKPDCSTAHGGTGSAPAIYAVLQGTGEPNNGQDALYQSHVQVTDAGASWIVTPTVDATTFSLSAAPAPGNKTTITLNKSVSGGNAADQVVLVMTKCR